MAQKLYRRIAKFILSVTAIATGTLAHADDSAVKPADIPNLTIDIQIVSLPVQIGTPLARSMMKKDETEIAYQQLQQLLAAGTARLVGWPAITTIQREREHEATVQAMDEFRHPTEWGAAGTSISFHQIHNANATQVRSLPPKTTNEVLNAVPTSFEITEIGSHLAITPKVHDGQPIVELTVDLRHTSLLGQTVAIVDARPQHNAVEIEQPRIGEIRATESFTVRIGKHVLLGFSRAANPVDDIQLAILSVTSMDLPGK